MTYMLSSGDIGRIPVVAPAEGDNIAFYDISTQKIGKATIANILLSPTITTTAGVASGTGSTSTVTVNALRGRITTAALTTAAAATHTITLTNSNITATDTIKAQVRYGSSTTGEPVVYYTTAPSASTAIINIKNVAASAAVNGTLVVDFWVEKNV